MTDNDRRHGIVRSFLRGAKAALLVPVSASRPPSVFRAGYEAGTADARAMIEREAQLYAASLAGSGEFDRAQGVLEYVRFMHAPDSFRGDDD